MVGIPHKPVGACSCVVSGVYGVVPLLHGLFVLAIIPILLLASILTSHCRRFICCSCCLVPCCSAIAVAPVRLPSLAVVYESLASMYNARVLVSCKFLCVRFLYAYLFLSLVLPKDSTIYLILLHLYL